MNNDKSALEMFHLLSYYTLSHPDPIFFIHQYAVDAFTAQYADENTKPITITFALIGLYLHLEKNFTGKEVQFAHMKLAKHRKNWPNFKLPVNRGDLSIFDVIKVPEGSNRDEAIILWCVSVWESYHDCHQKVTDLVQKELWN
jgi:hypothetical protein